MNADGRLGARDRSGAGGRVEHALQEREPLQPAGDAGEIAARRVARRAGARRSSASRLGVAGLEIRTSTPAPAGQRRRVVF
jgi:hypothetical protein